MFCSLMSLTQVAEGTTEQEKTQEVEDNVYGADITTSEATRPGRKGALARVAAGYADTPSKRQPRNAPNRKPRNALCLPTL